MIGYNGKEWQLKDRDGALVVVGKAYPDFRGAAITVTGFRPPHKEGSAGYVYSDKGHQLYVSVIGAKWTMVDP